MFASAVSPTPGTPPTSPSGNAVEAQVVEGQLRQLLWVKRGLRDALLQRKARHLRPRKRPVRDVEVLEAGRMVLIPAGSTP